MWAAKLASLAYALRLRFLQLSMRLVQQGVHRQQIATTIVQKAVSLHRSIVAIRGGARRIGAHP